MTAPSTNLAAASVRRPRTVLIGTMFASAAALMFYFGLLGVYVLRRAEARAAGTEWFPEGVVELGPSGWIFWTLILSVFTVQWAVQAIGNNDRPNAFVALGLTALFGGAIFNQMWFILNDTGFALAANEAQFLFFMVNGTFIVFLLAAVVYLLVTALRGLFGQYGGRKSDGVAAAAMFWNSVCFMYWVTWIAIYVTK